MCVCLQTSAVRRDCNLPIAQFCNTPRSVIVVNGGATTVQSATFASAGPLQLQTTKDFDMRAGLT